VPISKKCMHPACDLLVNGQCLMCFRHWCEVPPRIQALIAERRYAWRNLGAAREFLSRFLSSLPPVVSL